MRSARLVVAGVMMVAVVHMIPRMTDRQYFITALGGNKQSYKKNNDRSFLAGEGEGSQHLCFVSWMAFVFDHVGIDRYFFVFFW